MMIPAIIGEDIIAESMEASAAGIQNIEKRLRNVSMVGEESLI